MSGTSEFISAFTGALTWLISTTVVGLPVILVARPKADAVLLLAPVTGYAVMGVLSTILYGAGLTGHVQYPLFTAAGAAGTTILLGIRLREERPLRADAGKLILWTLGSWGSVMALLLVCMAIGGYRYFVFLGNHWDHVNYLTAATLFGRENYRTMVEGLAA